MIRSRTLEVIVLVAALNLAFTSTSVRSEVIRVGSIIDGDTIKLASGQNVRLLQIDTPEMRGSECFAQESREILAKILTQNGKLRLTTDPKLDQVDAYGRLLRYLFVGKTNVNLKMVREGAATPYFYRNQQGIYSKQLLSAAEVAKSKGIGLWAKCPGTRLNPFSSLTTVSTQSMQTNSNNGTTNCDINYKGCIPQYPPDLDCTDVRKLGLAPVTVIREDVHGLDRDGDGVGCD